MFGESPLEGHGPHFVGFSAGWAHLGHLLLVPRRHAGHAPWSVLQNGLNEFTLL
jgi:hypothetical protein